MHQPRQDSTVTTLWRVLMFIMLLYLCVFWTAWTVWNDRRYRREQDGRIDQLVRELLTPPPVRVR